MGRAHEEEILDRLLDGAEQKETSLLLRGDPGVGKTTLLDFAAARARRAGSDVVRVIGVESERELPFSGLHQLLFPLVGALEELPAYQRELLEQVLSFREGPTPARLAISAAALSLVLAAAGRAPLVVLIDDMQWIDRSSAEVLTFLLRRLAGRRPSFVLATRDRETGFFDPAGLPVLPVGPLAPDAARALLELRHPGLRAPLQRRLLAEAEGNPLALVELPGQLSQAQRDGLEEVPGSLPLSSRLESVFADRIRQLDPTTRMALLMVALDGERPGNLAEIRAALLLADRAWDETLLDRAATAGLVQVDHACERLTFRHPLARSCLLHMSPRTRRKAAHEVWAAALSAQRDRRAWHLAHAADGTDESVAAELADAAERMLARGGAAEAAAAFRRAAELSPKAEHRAARLNRSAFAASKGGLIDSADQALRPGSVDSLAGATAAAFVLLYRDGDINGVFRTLVPALEQAAAHPDPAADPGAFDDAFYMLLNCAVWAGQEELWPSVRTWLDHVSPTARMCFDAVADPARTAHGVRQRLDRETAELRPDSPCWRIDWLIYTSLYIDCYGFYDGAWRTQLGSAFDSNRFTQLARSHDAFLRGEWDRAKAVAEEGARACSEQDNQFSQALFTYVTAAVAAGRGDEETLGRCNEAILSWAGPRRLNLLLATVQETRARAAVGRGDFEEAYQQAAALTPPGRFPAHFPHLQRAFLDLVESAMRTGREPEARAHVDAARRTRMGEISPHHRLLLESAAALVAPDAEAGPLFEAALALPDASSWGWEYARLQLLYGEWLRRRREHTAARRHLSAAAETFDRLGAAVWAQRARQELRAAGVAVRVPSGTALVTMSAQERRIAELAATGLSNKEIGQQLNISPRTAGAHLYRVFPKLGVTTRAALRDALRDLEDDTHLVS